MINSAIHISREYAEAMFRRAVEPLPPLDYTPDWSDRPSPYTVYEGVERFALSVDHPASLVSMRELLERIATSQVPARRKVLTLNELALMLQFAHGILSCRLRIHPDLNVYGMARYSTGSFYARGTASGGGLYPTEIYWACGSGSAVMPGLYHYDNVHHALERLYTGDIAPAIRSAVFMHPAACDTNQFLLITLNFWKNAFKYNNFSYHVVTQDLGALLGSLWFLALGLGIDWQPIFWFRDAPLNQLLGLKPDYESVFAVVPLPAPSDVPGTKPESNTCVAWEGLLGSALVDKRPFQRSRKVLTFELNKRVHSSTLITNEPRPEEQAALLAGANRQKYAGKRVALPPPAYELVNGDLLETFQARRSSFGSFSLPPLSSVELATILSCASALGNYRSDVKPAASPSFTRLMVFVNHVEGIECGAYAYEADAHCLRVIREEDMTLFLQQHYFLQNYSMADTGAVIAIVGDLENMLAVYGNRGYRLLNTEAGLVAQGIYLSATAMSLACGAALGFDNVALNEMLGLDGTGQKTLLFVFVGHENTRSGDIDYRLV